MPFYFWLGLIGLGGAAYLLWKANAADRKDWIVERATPLTIALTNPRDDAWVSGQVECPAPLVVPHFGQSCIYYVYREQERIYTRQGTRWRTVNTDTNRVDFDLVDKTGRLAVLTGLAEFDGLQECGPDMEGINRRHLASYFPYPVHADAVGSISEDRRRLEKYGNIPLVVTGRTRLGYIARCERGETRMRYIGGFLLLFGVFALALGLSMQFGIPPVERYELPFHHPYLAIGEALAELRWPNLLPSAGVALTVFAGWWFFFMYNLLVTYRERVKTAWRHIDVDLKNRHDLIPELVTVIKGYAGHERQIAELLTALRYDPESGVGLDRRETAGVSLDSVWAVAERYPDLKANQLFMQLQNQLTALEEKLAFARQFYNDSLLEYDNTRGKFPAVVVARLIGRFPSYEPFDS